MNTYPFDASLPIGIEVKACDYLWDRIAIASRMHRAEFYHLIWVEEGKLRLIADFEALGLHACEAFLITPGQCCRFELGNKPQAFSVLFVPEFLGEASTDRQLLHHLAGASPLQRDRVIALHHRPVGDLLRQLMAELGSEPDEYQPIIARSCLRILLAEIARRLPLPTAWESSQLAQRFFHEVEQRHHQLHHVSEYIPLLAAPEKKLAQAIRQATGMAPKEYIDQRRLLEAKRLLVYSSQSIKEIAFSLGFDEPTNFNKFFRKHACQSPGDFRHAQVGAQ